MFRAYTTLIAFFTLVALVAVANPAAAQSEHNKAIARQKFGEGVTAYDAGEYEKARTLFLQAYALTRHPVVLLNLGQSELKSNHIEDAGNHLQQFLNEHAEATPQQKRSAGEGIAEAQSKTGFVILIVNEDNAVIAVDGSDIGKSPIADAHFVKPGMHAFSATIGNRRATSDVRVKLGTATPVTLTIGAAAATPPAPMPEPRIGPREAPYPLPLPHPYGADVVQSTGREDFFPWLARSPGAWVLTGVAGASLVGTIVFAALAGHRNASASSFSDQILAEVQLGEEGKASAKLPPTFWSNGDGTGEPQPCGTLEDPNTAFDHYALACNDLRTEVNATDDLLVGVGVFVPVFVASTAGLLVYYFVDSAGGDSQGSLSVPTVLPTAIITPDTQAFGVVGTF